MNTHADKKQENKSQSVANSGAQAHRGSESTFQFVDNRPQATAQRKLQKMANNSPQAKRAAQLQAMTGNHASQQQVIQMGGGVSRLRSQEARSSTGNLTGDGESSNLNFQDTAEQRIPFNGDLDPQNDAIRPNEKQVLEGQIAAQYYIDSLEPQILARCRQQTVSETAKVHDVQVLLTKAMGRFKNKQAFPRMYEDLENIETLGLQGNCMVVSPIFGYLLNRIHGEKVTKVHRPGGLGGPHTVLATTDENLEYIDATWRQGGNENAGNRDDAKRSLNMVRVSQEEPTMEEVNRAVEAALAS